MDKRRFRVEYDDGSPAREYRIVAGSVEMRTLSPVTELDEVTWWRLTSEQLSFHVERNTAVAQWLEYRMGWRRLLRACVGETIEPVEVGVGESNHQIA